METSVDGAALRNAGFAPTALPLELPLPELRPEADEARASAEHVESPLYELHVAGQELRSPVRFSTASGGAALERLHRNERLVALAEQLAGRPMEPSKCAYLYYDEGALIGLHTDIPACELTLLATVEGEAPPLVVHPELAGGEPEQLLELARASAGSPPGGLEVPIVPDAAVALLGGGLPHQTRPVAAARRSVVATLCYVGRS